MYKIVFLFLILLNRTGCAAQKSNQAKYIDEHTPSLVPQIFASNFISLKNESEFGSVFSKNGTEFYYAVDTDGKAVIKTTQLGKEGWTTPKIIISHEKYGFNDPFLSPDQKELFYISNMPRDKNDSINDIDIWYSKRTKTGWSAPINAGNKINSNKNEYYISFATTGRMYFASNKNAEEKRAHNFDIYFADRVNGQFHAPQKLGEAINTPRYEADVFIAPDESYIIFVTARREGFGNGDLYISFKDENDNWTQAKNMGASINTKANEICPFVSYDGKYFFYTSNQDIYWVSTEIFEKLRPQD